MRKPPQPQYLCPQNRAVAIAMRAMAMVLATAMAMAMALAATMTTALAEARKLYQITRSVKSIADYVMQAG